MGLYERYDADGVKRERAFTIDGSDEDARLRALAAAEAGGWKHVPPAEKREETPPPTPARTPMGPDDPAPPARNASTEVWRAYAVARGMDPAEAGQRSRDDLVAEYLGEGR